MLPKGCFKVSGNQIGNGMGEPAARAGDTEGCFYRAFPYVDVHYKEQSVCYHKKRNNSGSFAAFNQSG